MFSNKPYLLLIILSLVYVAVIPEYAKYRALTYSRIKKTHTLN